MRRAISILILVLACSRPGCGDSSDDDRGHDDRADHAPSRPTRPRRDGRRGRLHRRRRAGGARGRRRDRAEGAARPGEDLQARLRDELRLVHGHARPQAQAPATAASLVSLAKAGFYDDTDLPPHRARLRDPGRRPDAGRAAVGPGYQTVDPPPADATYTKGVVAMAKTGAEAAGTSGSQFFVVTGADVGLPPDYAIVGNVTSGIGRRRANRRARRPGDRAADAARRRSNR